MTVKRTRATGASTSTPRHGTVLDLPDILALTAYLRTPHTLTEAAAALNLVYRDITATLAAIDGRMTPDRRRTLFRMTEGDDRTVTVTSEVPGLPATGALTDLEGLVLLLGLETMADAPLTYDPDVVGAATARLRGLIDGDVIMHEPAPAPQLAHGVRDALQEALAARRCLRLRYRDGADRVSDRIVEPIAATNHGHRAYLHARDREQGAGTLDADGEPGAVKTFRFDRILAAEVTGQPVSAASRRTDIDAADPYGFGAATRWIRVTHDAEAAWVANYEPVLVDDDGAWLPADNRDRALETLLRRYPHLRAADEVDRRDVARRARAGLRKYAQTLAPDGAVNHADNGR